MNRENIEHLGYGLFLARLDELKESLKTDILPYPQVYEKLCRNFSISKQLCKRILHKLSMHGYIEFVNSKGIRLSKITSDTLLYLDYLDNPGRIHAERIMAKIYGKMEESQIDNLKLSFSDSKVNQSG